MTSPRTLLGPLTTTWTPPPVCSYAMALGCSTCYTGWQGQTCNPSSNAHDYTDCWPPRASSMPDPGVMMGWGFYSPGLVCPHGYTTAAMATQGGSTGWGLEYSLTQGETAAACCPTGFTPSSIETLNTYAATCVVVATSSTFSTVVCDSGTFTDFSLITVPNDDIKSFTVYAPLFQLNFQASDLAAATTGGDGGTAATGASPSATGGSGTSSTTSDPVASLRSSFTASSTSGASGSSPTSGQGLTESGKIGIGVGVAVGAILVIAALVLFWRSRRNESKRRLSGEDEVGLGSSEPERKSQMAEIDGDEVEKASGYRDPPQELAATGLSIGEPRQPAAIFELEANNPHTMISPVTPTRGEHH
ncbi:hypothetical protein BX600DRAFT_518407 [Xylariales sp. PMI_506]|nr:hypothetical protein BX600DRAFT_518407 [Xylariales sp. PMI_506]